METKHNEEERYYQATKKVEELKGFYAHLVSFILVNLMLIVINLTTDTSYLWFFWPLLSWGFGLFFHGMKVFDYMPFFNKEWEQKKINEFIEKDNLKSKTNEYK